MVTVGAAGSVHQDDQNVNHVKSNAHALTREKLLLLDNYSQTHHGGDLDLQFDLNNNNYTTAPELSNSSSSSASLYSVDSLDNHNNHHNNGNFYKYYNGSDSSIATIVQKLSNSTTSTINLQDLNEESTNSNIVDHDSNSKSDSNHVENIITNELDQDQPTTEDESITSAPLSSIPRSLKSSLKLPSLKRSKSLPSTKNVRFSSDLEKVKMFDGSQKPSSISLENSPDQSPPCYDDQYFGQSRAYFDLKDDMFFNKGSKWNFQYDDDDDTTSESNDEDDELDEAIYYRSKPKWSYKPLNFSLWRQADPNATVKLSSMYVEKDSIVGMIQVKNLSFEKSLEIKFTVDGWKTIYIVNANYDLSLDSLKDQFKFEINLNNSFMISNSKKSSRNQPITVELCIKYSTSGSDFYDNNHSSNFRFQLRSNKKQSKSKISALNTGIYQRPTSHITSNFASGLYNSSSNSSTPSPDFASSSKPYTTSRYFSDDTDYFNNKYLSNSSYSNPMLKPVHDSSSSSTASSIDSATSAHSETSVTSTSSNETIKANQPSSSSTSSTTQYNEVLNAQSLLKSRQNYNEFLKKFCFYKSDDLKRNEINEAPFIR